MLSTKPIFRAKTLKFVRFFSQTGSFSENTVPGVVKKARASNEWIDCVRFDSQNFNYTVKEFDLYSNAFAYGLLEKGYKPGDKLMLWADQESSAEIATAQVGAMKAGCSIVTVDDKDEIDHIATTLAEAGTKGLLLSPHTMLDGKTKRINMLLDILPELISAYPGEEVEFKDFPALQDIIHTGHVTIRGTSKFKENMSYVKSTMTNLQIPGCSDSDVAIESFSEGKKVTSITQSELVSTAVKVYEKYLDTENKSLPIFLTVSLQYPLGLATFVGSLYNGRKVFIPSTYNIAKIAQSFNFQKSEVLV